VAKRSDPWRAVEQELDHIEAAARPFVAAEFLEATGTTGAAQPRLR